MENEEAKRAVVPRIRVDSPPTSTGDAATRGTHSGARKRRRRQRPAARDTAALAAAASREPCEVRDGYLHCTNSYAPKLTFLHWKCSNSSSLHVVLFLLDFFIYSNAFFWLSNTFPSIYYWNSSFFFFFFFFLFFFASLILSYFSATSSKKSLWIAFKRSH